MSYELNTEACDAYFRSMPLPFAILELLCDDAQEPVDFILRYGNQALADLEGRPIAALLNRKFFGELFPAAETREWLPYYSASAFQERTHTFHLYSPELRRYLNICSYPWQAAGFCACILMDETELVESRIRLNYMASYDAMTQTLNKNSYQEFVKQYRPSGPVGVIFVDINSLKSCNDVFGHQTGDFLIKLVTDRINGVLHGRRSRVFRIGGDEFVIIMEDRTQAELQETADLLQKSFVNENISHFPEMLASVGFSWAAYAERIEPLLEQADQDMYTKKKQYHRQENSARSVPSQYRMWKERYRLGVEKIDRQHMELFRMTAELIEAITREADPEQYRKAIDFLKRYVVAHFRDEEAYQASIGYSGLKDHQKAHRDFTQTVLAFEQALLENQFELNMMRDLAGQLTAWLVYHVAGMDQKIVSGERRETAERLPDRCIDLFSACVSEVVEKMGGFRSEELRTTAAPRYVLRDSILMQANFRGALHGCGYFVVSNALARHLMQNMTMTEENGQQEMTRSAVRQLIAIACDSAARRLTACGLDCEVTSVAPAATLSLDADTDSAVIDTDAGGMELFLQGDWDFLPPENAADRA